MSVFMVNDMDGLVSFVVALLVFIGVYAVFYKTRRKLLPPGPYPLPIVGNLHQLKGNLHRVFHEWHQQYGPVFSVRLGSLPFVVVNDLDHAKDVLIKRGKLFAGRCNSEMGTLITRNESNIFLGQYTRAWKFHRKTTYLALHLFGEGMQKLERQMLVQVGELIQHLKCNQGTPVGVGDDIDWAVFSFIGKVVFGYNYDKDNSELHTLKQIFHTLMRIDYTVGLSDLIPILRYVTYFHRNKFMKDFSKAVKLRDQIFEEKLKSIRSTFVEGNVSNFTEALLETTSKAEHGKDKTDETLSHDQLVMSMFDVFLGGTESTSSSLKWAILYMTAWPDIQENVYKEIELLVGKPKGAPTVELKHRKSLPYVEATIMEILRLSSVSYMGLWHKTTCDVTLGGFEIPKGHGIIVNLYEIHHDERYFNDPYGFHPERFLDESGQLMPVAKFAYLPFSAGPRSCLGEPLAKASLFLFFANLVHHFVFSSFPSDIPPDLEGVAGINLSPKPYKVIFERRKT